MIEATDLTFGYRRGQAVVRDWSATIERGEVVAIVGASGSGKSTLLYVLGTLVRSWSGSLRLDGHAIEALGDGGRSDIRASRIGFVFQDAFLDQRRSIIDNVIEGAVYRGDDRRAAIERAHALLGRMNVRVEGTRRAMDLSGGQAQRIALCRALLDAPPILLADEPTGNLDRENGQAVEEALIGHARGGAAVVIVTHDERLAARCDRMYRL